MFKKILPLLILALPCIAVAKVSLPISSATGTVVSVTDGDTIKVLVGTGVETIRVLGLDTPEKYPTRYGYSECYGEEASHYVEGLLPVGTRVFLEFYGLDTYKRDLADVYIGTRTGSLLAEKVVRRGYGWVYRGGVETRNYKRLILSEKMASKLSLGLWSPSTCGGERRPVETSSGGASSQTGVTQSDGLASTTPSIVIPVRETSMSGSTSRVYYTGKKGGCYYYSSSHKKVYVDHSFCGR